MTTSCPSSPYCFCSSTSDGISARHGPHQVAQKFRTIGFPLNAASFTSTPFMSFSVKSSGAALPATLASATASSSAEFGEPVRLPLGDPAGGAPPLSAPGASMTMRIATATAAIAITIATLLGLRSGIAASPEEGSGLMTSLPAGCSASMCNLNNTR